MKRDSFKFGYILAIAAVVAGSVGPVPEAAAKPACRGVIEMIQPDGEKVYATLHGDERMHYMLSEEGFLLTTLSSEDNTIVYASISDEGEVGSTSIRAGRLADNFSVVAENNKRNLEKGLRYLSDNSAIKTTLPSASGTRGYGLATTSYPHFGSPKALVILVEYSDKKFNISNPNEYFSNMLHQEGFSDYGGTGSVRDYFLFNSGGKFDPEFDLFGPVTLPNKMSYYGSNDKFGNDQHPEMMAIHACNILDDEVDFSQYDTDGDGYIDNVYIFYAGYGEADGGAATTVWPHSWDIEYSSSKIPEYDGVKLNHYACSNETDYTTRRPDGIGTFVHEFSHVMGLPDLYCTAMYGNPFTPGEYSVLDYGPYNNDGRTPPNYSSFERYALSWMDPVEFDRSDYYAIPDLSTSNLGYILPTEKKTEFFLIENRQLVNNDRFLPGHGMLVWHIDFQEENWENNTVNNSNSHQLVDIVEADNKRNESSRSGDTFPGKSNVTEFSYLTKPSLCSWAGNELDMAFKDIAESEEGVITFKGIYKGDENGFSGISRPSVDSSFKAKVIDGCLWVSDSAEVFTLSGSRLAALGAGSLLSLPCRGVYLVRGAKGTLKINY